VLDTLFTSLSKLPANYTVHADQLGMMFQFAVLLAVLAALVVIPLKGHVAVKKWRARGLLWRDIQKLKQQGISFKVIANDLSEDKVETPHLRYLAEKRAANSSKYRKQAIQSLINSKGGYNDSPGSYMQEMSPARI
jgi:hypothetical protein